MHIILGLIALVALVLIVASFQPGFFKIERMTRINAPASTVFSHVNNFYKWNAWSPWAKMDPDAKQTHGGAPEGKGASMEWVGKKSGAGKMEIQESSPFSEIKIEIEFFKPMKALNDIVFSFKPDGNQTAVTWTMSGNLSLFMKAVHLFFSMDKFLGKDFEKGLADLKNISEN